VSAPIKFLDLKAFDDPFIDEQISKVDHGKWLKMDDKKNQGSTRTQ
jgi:hypothetical protein